MGHLRSQISFSAKHELLSENTTPASDSSSDVSEESNQTGDENVTPASDSSSGVSEESNVTARSQFELDNETDSRTEFEGSDIKTVNGYKYELINDMVRNSGDVTSFIIETRHKLRQYKALQKVKWFMKMDTDVNKLLRKDYDLEEAVLAVVSNRQVFLHQLFKLLREDDHL